DYAAAHGVHPAITTYLANKPQNFFRVRASGSGARIVTARGWEDLSLMISAYEREDLSVDGTLIDQYLQDREVAEDFALYFELFAKYQDDYKVADILAGKTDEAVLARARAAEFDERVAVVNLLLTAVTGEVHTADAAEKAVRATRDDIVAWKGELDGVDSLASLDARLAAVRKQDADARARGVASEDRQLAGVVHAELLGRCRMAVARAVQEHTGTDPYEAAKSVFNDIVRETAATQTVAATRLDRALGFLDAAFGDGQEMLVFTSRVATDPVATRFIAAHGPGSFAEHARALMFDERGLDLLRRLEALK
ncbi:MAG: ATPase, partial [Olegusella sp.]|nr:ATPase [Olegusella sp.]